MWDVCNFPWQTVEQVWYGIIRVLPGQALWSALEALHAKSLHRLLVLRVCNHRLGLLRYSTVIMCHKDPIYVIHVQLDTHTHTHTCTWMCTIEDVRCFQISWWASWSIITCIIKTTHKFLEMQNSRKWSDAPDNMSEHVACGSHITSSADTWASYCLGWKMRVCASA